MSGAVTPNSLSALMNDELVPAMLGELNVGVVRVDLNGKVLYRNAHIANLIGADTQVLDRDRWLSLIHPDDYLSIRRLFKQAISDGKLPVICSSRSRLGSSEFIATQIAVTIERDVKGNASGWLVIVAPQSSANAHDDMLRLVRDGETRYRALFDNASDAMLLMLEGVVVDCNDAALEMFRSTRERMIGTYAIEFAAETPAYTAEQVYKVFDHTSTIVMRDWTRRFDASLFESDLRLVRVVIDNQVCILAVVRDVTEQLASGREREQMLQTLGERNQSLQWLQHASAQLFAQPDMQSLGVTAIALLDQHYHASCSYVGLMEGDMVLTLACTRPTRLGYRARRYSYWDRVAREANRILIIDNIETGLWDGLETRAAMRARGVTTLVLVLLLDGEVELGTLAFEYRENTPFESNYLGDLEVFSHTLALALARAKHLEAIAFQADHDSLTGLHNRAVLHREFESWPHDENSVAALLLLDLDRFKEINDTLGHHVGDELLRQIGSRLQLGLSDRQAVICRLGGDEFAVMLLGQAFSQAQATNLGRELLAALRRSFLINGAQLEISASIGIALYPHHGSDSHALLRCADVAMYEAKRSGAGVVGYDDSLDTHSSERLQQILDLAAGIRNRELLLHYQPKLDLRSGRIIGCEALVRWQHPRQGLLAPDKFIPLAEMGETIHALTAYVIDEACRQHRQWRDAGQPLSVAVNLSARNLIDGRIVEHIERAIHAYGLMPGALELELTETALMQDPERAVVLLQRIAALGVRLSVDDFGTGYSSLGYLRQLPIHALKIDRTFINDMLGKSQDAVIVQSIISLAHNLGLEVVAEGVECADVLKTLTLLGCDQIQGYYVSRPLAPTQLCGWLRDFDCATYAPDSRVQKTS